MDIQKQFASLHNEFDLLTQELYKDLKQIETQIKVQDSQTWRRLYAKSLCSATEAQLSFLEAHIKLTGETDYLGISEEDEQILYGTSKKGKTHRKLSFTERTVFLMNTFSYVNYSTVKVDKGSKDWSEFTLLVKIRNRITHPQTFSDINITEQEIQTCERAFNRFQDALVTMMKACESELMKQVSTLKQTLSKLK
jgi:hypothetical protein